MSNASNQTEVFLSFAKRVAFEAGKIMKQHFRVGVANETKEDDTPLTIADTSINSMVVQEVRAAFPDHKVMGEEESSDHGDSAYVWVCDPIDGTIPYTWGMPTSLFSLALVKDGVPIVAVLYDPHMDRLYEAVKSQGAKMNGESIAVNKNATLAGNYVAILGMQYGLTDAAAVLKAAIKENVRAFSLYCITYECSMVATGQVTGCIFSAKTPWDIAAVKLIVEEAGGKVTDLDGNEQRYDGPLNGAVISNGVVHDQLLELVAGRLLPS